MTVVVATDMRGGMLFLGRRVSRDRALIADLARLQSGRLLCHPFSERYLISMGLSPIVCEDPLGSAREDDTCFIEGLPLSPHVPSITRLIVYRFDKVYPSDVSLDIDPHAPPFRLAETRELPGYAHKTLSREVYLQ